MSGRARSQEGAVALEAVLAVPLVAILVVGVLGCGGFLTDQLRAERTARVAARAAALGDDSAGLPTADDTSVSVRRGGRVVTVDVAVTGEVLGVRWTARASSAAPLEPVVP